MTTPMHIYENVTLRRGDSRTSASRRRTAGLSLMMSLCTQTLRTSTETGTVSGSQIKGSSFLNNELEYLKADTSVTAHLSAGKWIHSSQIILVPLLTAQILKLPEIRCGVCQVASAVLQ